MPDSWKDIDMDQILDFEEAHTGKMARFDRIVRMREIEALGQVWAGLHDLKKTMVESSADLSKRIETLERAQRDAAATESRLQIIAISLTVVIAVATVVYTLVTWQSVQTSQASNALQEEALATQIKANTIQEAAVAAQEQANRLQERSKENETAP